MQLIEAYNAQNKFGELLNMDFTIVEPGVVEYKMTIAEKHVAINQAAHGGAIAGMMDGVLGIAALSAVHSEGKYVATVEFKINYLKAALVGDELTGIGKVVRKGKRILVTSGEIKNQHQQLVAMATGTFTAYPAPEQE